MSEEELGVIRGAVFGVHPDRGAVGLDLKVQVVNGYFNEFLLLADAVRLIETFACGDVNRLPGMAVAVRREGGTCAVQRAIPA